MTDNKLSPYFPKMSTSNRNRCSTSSDANEHHKSNKGLDIDAIYKQLKKIADHATSKSRLREREVTTDDNNRFDGIDGETSGIFPQSQYDDLIEKSIAVDTDMSSHYLTSASTMTVHKTTSTLVEPNKNEIYDGVESSRTYKQSDEISTTASQDFVKHVDFDDSVNSPRKTSAFTLDPIRDLRDAIPIAIQPYSMHASRSSSIKSRTYSISTRSGTVRSASSKRGIPKVSHNLAEEQITEEPVQEHSSKKMFSIRRIVNLLRAPIIKKVQSNLQSLSSSSKTLNLSMTLHRNHKTHRQKKVVGIFEPLKNEEPASRIRYHPRIEPLPRIITTPEQSSPTQALSTNRMSISREGSKLSVVHSEVADQIGIKSFLSEDLLRTKTQKQQKRSKTVNIIQRAKSDNHFELSHQSLARRQQTVSSQRRIVETSDIYCKADSIYDTVVGPWGEPEHRQGKINQYHILKDIGSGAYARVALAVSDDTGRYYACKVICKSRLRKKFRWMYPASSNISSPSKNEPIHPEDDPFMAKMKREVAILKKLSQHPNIVNLVEVLDNSQEDNLYMIFDLCEFGPVMEISVGQQARPFSEGLARKYFRDIVLGLEYCK